MNTLKNKWLGSVLILALTFGLASCEKDFDETNTNPNEPTAVPTSYLLTSAQKQLMDDTWDEWFNGRRGNQLAQYWASNQYSSESRYQLRVTITNSYWTLFYAGSNTLGGGMQDLQEIIRLCTEDAAGQAAYGDPSNQIAVAMILKSWIAQNMTDCWGAMPYSQALQGTENTAPGYDSQEAVYNKILSDLSAANDMINTGAAGPSGDQIYGGDMDLWKKFCNSLRMRAAMRIADKAGTLAGAEFADAVSDGAFADNSENAMYPYSSAPDNNPINNAFLTRNDFASSNTMIDVLLDLGDPRIGFYYEPALNSGTYVGEVYGLTETDAALTPDADVSQLSPLVKEADFPGIYMDYAQVEFLMAEGVERGFITGSAEDHYNAGITASMNWWNDMAGGAVTGGDIDAYIAQPSVAYATAGADWKETIGKQKWISLYMQGIQGWSEWRRLDFGILQIPAGGVLDGDGIPLRMKYPNDEQTLNGASYQAAVNSQGSDLQNTKLWWDQ